MGVGDRSALRPEAVTLAPRNGQGTVLPARIAEVAFLAVQVGVDPRARATVVLVPSPEDRAELPGGRVMVLPNRGWRGSK